MESNSLENIEKLRLSIKLSINLIEKVLKEFTYINFLEVN
jgi:hypothetical protein